MALSKQRTLRVRNYPLIILAVIVAAVVIGASTLLNSQKETTPQQTVAEVTPTPAPPVITQVDAYTKKVSFPEYRVSFQIASNLLYEGSIPEIPDSVIYFETSDIAIEKPIGTQLHGVWGTVGVSN